MAVGFYHAGQRIVRVSEGMGEAWKWQADHGNVTLGALSKKALDG